MDEILVSIIITTYERNEKVIKRAIDSVFNQTYKNWELIVVDDNKKDEVSKNVQTILNEINDTRIIYIKNEENMGSAKSRNHGIEKSKGKYITFLDDDDEWEKEKLEKQLKKILSDHSALVYCDYYYIDKNGKMNIRKSDKQNLPGSNDFERLLCCNFIGSTSFPLIKTSVLKSVGGFNKDLQSSQDHELWLRIAQKYEISYINEPLVKYYFTDIAITRSIDKKIQGFNYILNEFKNEYNNNPEILHYRYIFISNVFFGNHCLKLGLQYLKKAFIIKPLSVKNLSVIPKVLKKVFNIS